MGSVSESLDLVRPYLPPDLDETALERVSRIAARVPDAATSHYLELRLNAGPQIDFLTFSTSKSVAAHFEGELGLGASPRWQQNLAVLKQWAAPDGELRDVPFFSFEYDAGDRFEAGEPDASLSPGTCTRYLNRHTGQLFGETAETMARGKRAFRCLLPERSRDACMKVIDRLYAALPPDSAIPHAPVMTARDPVVAKPYVILPRSALFSYLERIEWPGSMAALERLLGTYYEAFQKTVYLDLTVTDHVHARLGLVTSQFQKVEADFSNLEWWGLPHSLSGYKRALAGWCGCTEQYLAGSRIWMRRWLDTKAVLHDTETEYKAYLGFSPAPPPLFC